MKHRPVNMIEKVGYVIFYIDLSNADETEVCNAYDNLSCRAQLHTGPFAIVNNAENVMITPQMNICMGRLSKELIDTGRLIGISIFGQDRFLTYVIRRAYKKMTFGDSLDDCLKLIEEQYLNKAKASVN